MPASAELGVFGGSGLYSLLDEVTEVVVDTPYGPPSAPLHIGTLDDGRRVAFLPRHGRDHEHPPHRVPYRANVWAMHAVGVRELFAPCASGSLRAAIEPGSFVVPDQLVDRTSGRPDTFFDGPLTHHVAFADPYCPQLRRVAVEACRADGVAVHDGGTVVTVQGPRFSTRAESAWFASMGWDVVNMTQHPEAVLAREAGLCYAAIALITDHDVGVAGADVEPVTQAQVFERFEANLSRVRGVLMRALAATTAHACGVEPGPGFARADAG